MLFNIKVNIIKLQFLTKIMGSRLSLVLRELLAMCQFQQSLDFVEWKHIDVISIHFSCLTFLCIWSMSYLSVCLYKARKVKVTPIDRQSVMIFFLSGFRKLNQAIVFYISPRLINDLNICSRNQAIFDIEPEHWSFLSVVFARMGSRWLIVSFVDRSIWYKW